MLTVLCARICGRARPGTVFLLAAALAGLAYGWLRLPQTPGLPQWIDQRPKGVLAARVQSVEEKPGGRLEILLDSLEFRFAPPAVGKAPRAKRKQAQPARAAEQDSAAVSAAPQDTPNTAPEDADASRSLSGPPPGADGAFEAARIPAADAPPALPGPHTEKLPGTLVWTWQDPAFEPAIGSRVLLAARPHATGGFNNPGPGGWGWRWRVRGVFLRAYTVGAKGVTVEEPANPSALQLWRKKLSRAILLGASGAPPDALAVASAPHGGHGPARQDPASLRQAQAPFSDALRQPADQTPPAGSSNPQPDASPADVSEAPPPDPQLPALAGQGLSSAAGMVLGLITGERYAISREDLDRVRRASLSHLLAVSGMNLAAVAAMGWALAWLAGLVWPGAYSRLARPRLTVVLAAPLVAGYLWLGRFEPSLTRAAFMFAVWGVLVFLGRPRVLLDGLFFALAAMYAWDPLCVFDVGLQLSACAVAGLTLLTPLAAPLLGKVLGRNGPLYRRPELWRTLAVIPLGWVVVTLAAQLGVLPIQFGVFGEASPHLYLNLLWVPVVEWAAQPLAYLGALSVLWLPQAGGALLHGSAQVCGLMLESLKAMDASGWLTTYPVQRPWQPEVLGYFLLVGGLGWAARLARPQRLAWLGLCAALLAGPPLWRTLEQSLDRVRLTVLDVGQGQAVLVEARGGRRWLFDAGGSLSSGFDMGRAVVAPALTWGRPPRLDGAVMSHADRDHTGGLAYLLRAFRISFLAGNGEIPGQEDFQAGLAASGLIPAVWRAGQLVDLGGGLAAQVCWPAGDPGFTGNDASLVVRLTWRGRGLAVLTGDAGKTPLSRLAASQTPLEADVLVPSHHGSATGLSPAFYRRVGARFAAISCARGNMYGFPSPKMTGALEAAGATIMTTARSGALTFTWDSPDQGPRVSSMR